MAHYHASVQSRSSSSETFGYLATFSNAQHWDPGVLTGEQIDPGPVGAGTRFRLVVPFLGLRMSLTYEVLTHIPDREVVLAATNWLLRSTDRIEVTADTDGSTVTYDADVRLRGPLAVLDPVLRPGFRAVAQRAAAGLARALSADRPALRGSPPGTPAHSGAAAGPPPAQARSGQSTAASGTPARSGGPGRRSEGAP